MTALSWLWLISSIIYKPKNIEILAKVNEPTDISQIKGGFTAENLLDLMFIGGYYEVLPNAGYLTEINGAKFGLHDETPYIPWKLEYDEERDENSILLITTLRKVPLKIYKRISISDNIIKIDERVINQSKVPIPFSWLHHPAFGEGLIDEYARLEIPGKIAIEVDSSIPSENACLEPGYKGTWPYALSKNGEMVDLSRVPPKGIINCDDLVYVPEVEIGTFNIVNKQKGVQFTANWDKSIYRTLWVWFPFGGGNTYPWYGRMHCMAVEITTSYPASGLAEQVKLGRAKWIQPSGTIGSSIEYQINDI